MASLQITQNNQGDGATLTLNGQIDENADYSSVKFVGLKRLVFDFGGVTLINSTGLQRWVNFLSSIPPGLAVTFVRCPVRVINQINMFPGFTAGRSVGVDSFYAPYFCATCDKSSDVLLDTKKQFPDRTKLTAPPAKCDKCQGSLEFDGIEKKFFVFLKPS